MSANSLDKRCSLQGNMQSIHIMCAIACNISSKFATDVSCRISGCPLVQSVRFNYVRLQSCVVAPSKLRWHGSKCRPCALETTRTTRACPRQPRFFQTYGLTLKKKVFLSKKIAHASLCPQPLNTLYTSIRDVLNWCRYCALTCFKDFPVNFSPAFWEVFFF